MRLGVLLNFLVMICAHFVANMSNVVEAVAIRVAAHTFTFVGKLICQLSQFQTAAAKIFSLIWQETVTLLIDSCDNRSLLLIFAQSRTPSKIL